MAYMPKRIKHRKVQRGKVKGYAQHPSSAMFIEDVALES